MHFLLDHNTRLNADTEAANLDASAKLAKEQDKIRKASEKKLAEDLAEAREISDADLALAIDKINQNAVVEFDKAAAQAKPVKSEAVKSPSIKDAEAAQRNRNHPASHSRNDGEV